MVSNEDWTGFKILLGLGVVTLSVSLGLVAPLIPMPSGSAPASSIFVN